MRASVIASSLLLGLALSTPARGGEVVRTVQAELSGQDLANFAVENLAGTMRVTTGSGATVTVVATVHAESQALADAVRVERVRADGGAAGLRVRYGDVSSFRYLAPGESDGWGLGRWDSSSTYDYDGRRVRVSPRHGTSLYADLEVRVPSGHLTAAFRNRAGLIVAEGLNGKLLFEVSSADLRLSNLEGELTLEGSSGDTRARDIQGTWKSDFSSGDLQLDGFDGDRFVFHATSGDAVLRSVKARRVELETTSGDVRLADADLEELASEATSGDLAFENEGARLRDVRIRTSSGDVSLRLPSGAAFDLVAHQSSGDMDVRFSDGTSTRDDDRVVGYRRGNGGAHIQVRTSSGDLTVSPV